MTTLVFLLTLLAATFQNVVIHDGPRSYIDGDSSLRHLSDLGDHYAYFERDGAGYVIHDAATLAKLRTILRPQVDLGAQQAELGQRQAELGQKQAELGQRQASIGLEQIDARGERAQRLQRRQRELGEEQSALAEQQRPLAEQQRQLAAKQREAARIAKAKMEQVFDDAIRTGNAKRR
jgi:bla regulator protein BlaR1